MQQCDRRRHWKEHALLVRQRSDVGSRNAAASMSEVSLAALQRFCYAKPNLQSVMHKEITPLHFDFSEELTISRHQVCENIVVA